MIQQAGGTVVDGMQVALGGPDLGVKAMQRSRRFVTEDGMPLIGDDQSRQQLASGKVGIYFDTPARLKQLSSLVGDKFALRSAIFPIVVETTGYLPTNLRAPGAGHLGPFYAKNPNYRTAAEQSERSGPWVGYPAGNTVRIWRAKRDIINAVMRGDLDPAAGYDKIAKDTAAMMRE